MPANFMPTAQEYLRFAPESLLILVGVLLMIMEPLSAPGGKRKFAVISFAALAAAIGLAIAAGMDQRPGVLRSADGGRLRDIFRVLVLAIGMFVILISTNYLKLEGHESGEYCALLLFSIVGQCLMAASNDLIMLFIGLECSSIASYVLAGYLRDDKRNNESALKYFLLGSFATAFLLYGVAWIYRRHGHYESQCHPRISDGPRPPRQHGGGGRGHGADVRRLCVQGIGRPVSDVGAGRLSGRARAGHRIHVNRLQGGRLRDVCACHDDSLRAGEGTLGASHLDLRAGHHDHRQLRRSPPIQPQASARLQLHRARRLPDGGHHRAQRDRHGVGHVLSHGLRADEPGRLRHRGLRRTQG